MSASVADPRVPAEDSLRADSGARRRLRAVAHFFALAVVVLIAQRAWVRAQPVRQVLRVIVPPGVSAADRAKRIDDAILVEQGIELGWPRTDTVIRARLATNLRFARGERELQPASARDRRAREAEDEALVAEAIRLGMHRTDLVVRRRLVGRAERMMARDVQQEPVDDATLIAYRNRHRERFAAPSRVRYSDVFVAHQRHPDDFDAAVAAVGRQIERGQVRPEAAATLSEPLLVSPGPRWVSVEDLGRRLGGSLAQHIERAPVGAWSGPFASSFGAHFVFVHERREGTLPTLDDARARILGSYREERRETVLRQRMAELRARFVIHVVEREGAR